MGTIDRRSAMLTARKELVMALYELGMSFLKGWGVNKDKVAAFHYFKLAADLGDPDSQNEVAQCFLDGIGTEKNAFEAARYYRLASAQGASQLGNSWIWKPKYDQYCEQHAANANANATAAAPAATATSRKKQQHPEGASSADTAGPCPVSPTNSIAAGLASMTASAASMATPLGAAAAARTPDAMSLLLGGGRKNSERNGMSGASARKDRYNLAGDLISSSQLELKLRQAEQLTSATIGAVVIGDMSSGSSGQDQTTTTPTTKKKHRWSLFPHHLQHRRSPSSG
ncbi:hypothetical protein BGZ54_000189 [Gamsiella multidivaricata]|nr:hypothetical protein BGZ54_000189 [Gamsiella multidivaricata]